VEVTETEIGLALEYARLKNPLVEVIRIFEKQKSGKKFEKKTPEGLFLRASRENDSAKVKSLGTRRVNLVQEIERLQEKIKQTERILKDFQPFDLIHELSDLKEEKEKRAGSGSAKEWEENRIQENEKKIHRLEAALRWVPPGDLDWVRWAIDELKYEKAHPTLGVSIETRAKVATIIRYGLLLTEDPHKNLDTAKPHLENGISSSSPRAPFLLAQLFEGKETEEKTRPPETQAPSPEGSSPERYSSEGRTEDPQRKPSRGPGGRGLPEIRSEDPLELLKGPEELRDLFEGRKGRGGIHR
jgi:hypothetical protein